MLNMNYSKILKKYRESNFLTQKDLGTIIGVSDVTISRWETNKFQPSIKIKKIINDLVNKNKEENL